LTTRVISRRRVAKVLPLSLAAPIDRHAENEQTTLQIRHHLTQIKSQTSP
jgi:hypothetical protein